MLPISAALHTVRSQLTASFKSALGGLGTSEPSTLSKLAGGLASWWSSLDPPAAPKRDEMAERVQASSKVRQMQLHACKSKDTMLANRVQEDAGYG